MKKYGQSLCSVISLLALSMIGFSSYSQTYSYTYRCTISGIPGDTTKIIEANPLNTSDGTGNDFDQLLHLIPIRIHTVYEIISDGKYMLLHARVDSSSTENFDIKVRPSGDDIAIISIKEKLIFFPGSKIIKKIKIYTLDSSLENFDGCMDKTVHEKGPDYIVKLCKDIPSAVSPPIFFNGLKYGIKSVNVPGITIELSVYKKTGKDKRLSQCAGYFKKYPVSAEEEGFFD